MSSTKDLISVKELASKLDVSDALLKKLIKDFDIEVERVQKRIHLPSSSVLTVREILALKASGKKNKEIKELFDEAKKAEATEESPSKETETSQETVKEKEEETKKTNPKNKEETSKEDKKKEEKSESRKKTRDSKNPRNNNKRKSKKPTDNADESANTGDVLEILPTEIDDGEKANYISYLDESEEDEENLDDIDLALEAEEGDGEDEDIEEIVEEEIENYDKPLGPLKRRRRAFSYRYIQRQIANDTKRVNYIKNKLKRSRLSSLEKINLQDSLEKRSRLLGGWIHLLRWVKS